MISINSFKDLWRRSSSCHCSLSSKCCTCYLSNISSNVFEKTKNYIDIEKEGYQLRQDTRHDDLAAFAREVNILINDMKLNEASNLINNIMNKYPNESECFYYRGILSAKRNLLDEAINDLQTSIDMNNTSKNNDDNDNDERTKELIIVLQSRIKQSEFDKDNNSINKHEHSDSDVNNEGNEDKHKKKKRKKKEKKKKEKKTKKRRKRSRSNSSSDN